MIGLWDSNTSFSISFESQFPITWFSAKEPLMIGLWDPKTCLSISFGSQSPLNLNLLWISISNHMIFRKRVTNDRALRSKDMPLNLLWISISFESQSPLNLNLQSQSHGSLCKGTWQKSPRQLDHRLRFDISELASLKIVFKGIFWIFKSNRLYVVNVL